MDRISKPRDLVSARWILLSRARCFVSRHRDPLSRSADRGSWPRISSSGTGIWACPKTPGPRHGLPIPRQRMPGAEPRSRARRRSPGTPERRPL